MRLLREKIAIIFLVYTVVLVTTMSYIYRSSIEGQFQSQATEQQELIEKHILSDMQVVDHAYVLFDNKLAQNMQENMDFLMSYYQTNPSVETWDYQQLKKKIGMDLYVINKDIVVEQTSFTQDLNLNFRQCCSKFAQLLDDRRLSGDFYHDGIDVSQNTGEISKFSYQGTPDKKYLFELRLGLENEKLFDTFNFLKSAKTLVDHYENINNIRIFNQGGFAISENRNDIKTIRELPKTNQDAFKKARETMKPTSIEVPQKHGIVHTVRYIPYKSDFERGQSNNRVIEVTYSNEPLMALMEKSRKQYWINLVVSIVIATFLVFLVLRMLKNTLYIAKYDILTGIYNRATYLHKVNRLLQAKRKKDFSLLLMDLDHFKKVNDQFGHSEGDRVLQQVANILKDVVGKSGFVARLGGDEFAIVLYRSDQDEMERVSTAILDQVRNLKENKDNHDIWCILSCSIGGITVNQSEFHSVSSIYRRADECLYYAKQNGKDQYCMITTPESQSNVVK